MLIDGRAVPRNYTLETDVCIVGAGAAGITLATEQPLYRGNNTGLRSAFISPPDGSPRVAT